MKARPTTRRPREGRRGQERSRRRRAYRGAGSGSAAPSFFLISPFSANAFCERSASAALSKKLSRPPRCSTDRKDEAAIRSRTERPSESEVSVTLHRLGKKRVRVLRLEWLTLLPV